MWYLLRAGASEEEPTTGLPWAAIVVNKEATAAVAAGATAAAAAGAVGGAAAVAAGPTEGTAVATTGVVGGRRRGEGMNCAP